MTNLKRIVSVFLAVICLTACIYVPAHAATYNKTALVSYLTKEFENRSTEIDISSYRIPQAKYNEIYNLIEAEIPFIFCTSRYSIYSNNGMCKYIKSTYIDKSEYNTMLKKFNNNTEYLLRGLKSNNLSDEEKILLVHDRLIAWCEYDYVSLENDNIPKNSARAFGVIVNKTAVCAGYARAFLYLMEKLGIECEYISTKDHEHAWNIVTLNGKQYHVDLTWDDTRCVGEVEHDNLLRSTSGILSTGHDKYEFDTSPYDTTYDKYYWQKSSAEIQYFNGAFYYIDETTGNIIKRCNGIETVITTVYSKWVNNTTGGSYCNCFSKLCSDDNYLYYTTPDSVYSIDASGHAEKVYSPNIPYGLSIYGFNINNGCFNVYCYETPNFEECGSTVHKLTYKYTNVNGLTDETAESDHIDGSSAVETLSSISFDITLLLRIILKVVNVSIKLLMFIIH